MALKILCLLVLPQEYELDTSGRLRFLLYMIKNSIEFKLLSVFPNGTFYLWLREGEISTLLLLITTRISLSVNS